MMGSKKKKENQQTKHNARVSPAFFPVCLPLSIYTVSLLISAGFVSLYFKAVFFCFVIYLAAHALLGELIAAISVSQGTFISL